MSIYFYCPLTEIFNLVTKAYASLNKSLAVLEHENAHFKYYIDNSCYLLNFSSDLKGWKTALFSYKTSVLLLQTTA